MDHDDFALEVIPALLRGDVDAMTAFEGSIRTSIPRGGQGRDRRCFRFADYGVSSMQCDSGLHH